MKNIKEHSEKKECNGCNPIDINEITSAVNDTVIAVVSRSRTANVEMISTSSASASSYRPSVITGNSVTSPNTAMASICRYDY